MFSYCGAQIFEIYGLGKEVVDLAFCGSVSKIGGVTFDEVRNTLKMELFFFKFNSIATIKNMYFHYKIMIKFVYMIKY